MSSDLAVKVVGDKQLLLRLTDAEVGTALGLEQGMKQATLYVEGEAKKRVPRKTGRLFSSLQSVVSGAGISVKGQVGTNVSYAPYVENGTAPHDISAKGAGALSWPGAAHPVVAIHHPGTRPKPFLVPALKDSAQQVTAILRAAINVALRL